MNLPFAPQFTSPPTSSRRYRRRQLLRLSQDDGKLFWVDSKELAGNAHCMLLAKDPVTFAVMQVRLG